MEQANKKIGFIKQIIGAVVDVHFDQDLPDIYTALEINQGEKKIVLEVQQHLGSNVVRTISMDSTDGLKRGDQVINTGKGITVPVGEKTLGRILNVLGDVIDGGEELKDSKDMKFMPSS